MKRSGYTLVEVMMVVVVLGVLSAAISSMITQSRDAAEFVEVRAQLTESARIAMAEIVRDLAETSASTVTLDLATGNPPVFVDMNGETHQILVFASGRGNPASPGEDGSATNDYFHLDADHKPVWRSVIVYCTYVTPDGIQQLRKYVDYNNAYSNAGVFPFSVVSVTANTITLQRGDGVGLAISRSFGSARANYITSEVTGPADNNDGAIDNGADFTASASLMRIKLFLSQRELRTRGGIKRVMVTLTDSVVMRNK